MFGVCRRRTRVRNLIYFVKFSGAAPKRQLRRRQISAIYKGAGAGTYSARELYLKFDKKSQIFRRTPASNENA